MFYKLLDAREAKRRLGNYANTLRAVINIGADMLTESDWRAKIGDKFDEAITYGILVETYAENTESNEELEREGPVIKENPPKTPPLTIATIDNYTRSTGPNWNHSITANIGRDNATGKLRFYQSGSDQSVNKEEWSTDNLDLINQEVCDAIASGDISNGLWQLIQSNYDNNPFGQDQGPLKYSVHSRCIDTDQ